MATAENFVVDGDYLGRLYNLEIEAENPIDYQGNQRGLTGPIRLSAKRDADHPTIKLVKAYVGNNGICTPLKTLALDVNGANGERIYHLTLHDAKVRHWTMDSPEQPEPVNEHQPEMNPNLEGFTIESFHGIYQSGGGSASFKRSDS